MFDPTKEKPLSMGELSHAIREKYQGLERTPRTLALWIKVGLLRQSDGEVIQLEGRQIGGLICSSLEAYERFDKRLNGELE